MENFSVPFFVTTTTRVSSSSSNVSRAQQHMGQNHQFSYDNPLHTRQNGNVHFGMLNSQLQGQFQLREDNKKMAEGMKCRTARNKRKQARQRSRSSAPKASFVPEGTIRGQHEESNVRVTNIQNKYSYDFRAPDGKILEEILTKELKNSDVGTLRRIVLPKREVEEKLPALWDKEGIHIALKDIYSEKQWSFKFKYWSNYNSRMYVIENTGDFVKYYGLKSGDSITFYEDKDKKLYVSTKKGSNHQVSELSSEKENMQTDSPFGDHDTNNEDNWDLLIKGFSHEREEVSLNSLFTLGNGGNTSSQMTGEAIEQASSSSFKW